MFRLRNVCVVIGLAVTLALTACTSEGEHSGSRAIGAQAGYPYTFAVITHGSGGDQFWSIVKAGAVRGGADEHVSVNYRSDADPQKQAQLIDAAVNEKVDGIVISMANPDALHASISKAIAAGIPVITVNSGLSRSKEFGALTHVGQDETIAGAATGERLKALRVVHLLCVIHEAGNVALEQRCSSTAESLGGRTENLQVDNNNRTGAQATIKAKLQQDSSIDGVLTLGGQMAVVADNAIREAGSKAELATFDLNATIAQLVTDGRIQFAVDQQPFVQGYLPIVLLMLYKSNLNSVGEGHPVLTGPNFVTKDNAARIVALAKAGTR